MSLLPKNDDLTQVLDRLYLSRDFKRFIEWLEAERRGANDALLNSEEVAAMQRNQGKVLALDHLLTTIHDAPRKALEPVARDSSLY